MRSYFKIIYQLKKDLVDDMRKNISNWPVFNPKDTTKTQEQLKFQQKKFIKFTTNILKLGFEDAPNYIKLRKILRDIDSVETRHGFFWVRQQLRMRDSLRNQKFIEILNKELTSEIRTKQNKVNDDTKQIQEGNTNLTIGYHKLMASKS